MAVDINSIIKQYQQSMANANQANEDRYQEILGIYGDTGGMSLMDLVGNLGQSETQAIDTAEAQGAAKAEQGLISRGLGNTTARSAQLRDVANMADLARTQAGETQLGRGAGALEAKANTIEGRYDTGPDASLFSQLVAQASNQTDQQTGRATGLGGPSRQVDGTWGGAMEGMFSTALDAPAGGGGGGVNDNNPPVSGDESGDGRGVEGVDWEYTGGPPRYNRSGQYMGGGKWRPISRAKADIASQVGTTIGAVGDFAGTATQTVGNLLKRWI